MHTQTNTSPDATSTAQVAELRAIIERRSIKEITDAIRAKWMLENVGHGWEEVKPGNVATFKELRPRLKTLDDGLRKVRGAFTDPAAAAEYKEG
jgi:hypothetical protein